MDVALLDWTKPGISELDMLPPQEGGVADVPKTMIFVDSINEGIRITTYLRSMLDESNARVKRYHRPTICI